MANCKCHQIGKKMGKTRKSGQQADIQTVGGIALGIGAGALGVPFIVGKVDPEGKIDPKIINGAGAVGAYFISRNQKGFIKSALQGLTAGLAWNVLANITGMAPGQQGLGYVNDNSTRFLNPVAGLGDGDFPSRQNPGAL